MQPTILRPLFFLVAASSVAVAAACSSSDATPGASPSTLDAGTSDTSPLPTTTATSTNDSGGPPTPQTITFSYKPSWTGVKSVEVLGAFGQATDWTAPFVALTDNGTGTFTGTSPALANGSYLYIFHVIGDSAAAAAKAETYSRYAIDPTEAAFAACPKESPSFAADAPNPCSNLSVPRTASPTFHTKGVVDLKTAPVAGYLVEIERNEAMSHHMFANRVTTAADGTFDLAVAPGTYRFQVLHPTFYAMTDAQRADPGTLAAVRRTISSNITVTAADVEVNAAEVAYETYAAMEPRGATTLPTTFTFGVAAKTKARAAIYGPGNEIGDPWWVAPFADDTTDEFDGGFNTAKAADGGLKPDASYFWGTEQESAKPDGGVVWTAQSMVFPIKWN